MMIEEVGYLAKLADKEMTMTQRMKIKKSTLKRIGLAMLVYFSTMITFSRVF